jgi:hypothetical protein
MRKPHSRDDGNRHVEMPPPQTPAREGTATMQATPVTDAPSFTEPENITREPTLDLTELEDLSLDPNNASTPQPTRKAPYQSRDF